jgi:aspartokinase-like uncharacterized kinase
MGMTEGTGITVIKLGGSLADTPELRAWLRLIAETSPAPVVVPGGGPFADTVRTAQVPLQLDDATCHRMALLAMAQFGFALAGIESRLKAAESLARVRGVLAEGLRPVWLPLDLLAGNRDIEESWRVTSDSLALWLARQLGAARLVLVKSGDIQPGQASPEALTESGLLDAAFGTSRRDFSGEVLLVHRSSLDLSFQTGCRCLQGMDDEVSQNRADQLA